MAERFIHFIERIREKPESVRWALLSAITLIFVVLMLAFWTWNLSRQLSDLANPASKSGSRLAELITPFQSLKKSAAAIKQGESSAESQSREPTEKPPAAAENSSPASRFMAGVLDAVRLNLSLVGETLKSLF